VVKPFSPRELLSRVRAVLRRSRRTAPAQPNEADLHPLACRDLTLDPKTREVTVKAEARGLTAKEFDLLLTMVENRGLVLTREQLLNLVWGFDFYGQTRTVDVHVAHLRKSLAGSSVSIETVTGVGYKLVG